MPKYFFLIFRVILYLFPVGVVVFTASHYFAFSGIQESKYDFQKESSLISILWPPEHVSDPYLINGDFAQNIEKDPVSFSVSLTRPSFQKITIFVRYKKNETTPLRFGLQKGDGSWDFYFKEIKKEDIKEIGEWQEGFVVFDITPEYMKKGNKLNILVSSPGLSEKGEKITFSEIRVRLERNPVTFKHFVQKIGIFYE